MKYSRHLGAGIGIIGRDNRRAVAVAVFVVVVAGHASADAQPSASGPVQSNPEQAYRVPSHRVPEYTGYPGYPGAFLGPEIGVSIHPNTEHWPSNYVPDGYRLGAYDGQGGNVRVCRGQSGTTISTRHTKCPKGQHPGSGGHVISTFPDGN